MVSVYTATLGNPFANSEVERFRPHLATAPLSHLISRDLRVVGTQRCTARSITLSAQTAHTLVTMSDIHTRLSSVRNTVEDNFIRTLPIEVLEKILVRVDIEDLFALKQVSQNVLLDYLHAHRILQTCREFHSKLDSDHLWHTILPSLQTPIDLPHYVNLRTLTASQLQSKCLHTLRWQANLRSTKTSFKKVQLVTDGSHGSHVQSVRFLPGLNMLLVTSTVHITETPTSLITVYAYNHILGSHAVVHLDLPYLIRDTCTSVTNAGSSLGIGVTFRQSGSQDEYVSPQT